jgi:hypothetical protein
MQPEAVGSGLPSGTKARPRSLTFYLQFRRPANEGDAPGAPALAHGGKLVSTIEPDGVAAFFEPLGRATAVLENQYTLNQDGTMFFEWGTVTFGGSANRITFSSIGPGYILGKPDPVTGMEHGTVMWKITGGSGFFEGASGAIVSNFLVNPVSNELIDNHLYLVHLPQ